MDFSGSDAVLNKRGLQILLNTLLCMKTRSIIRRLPPRPHLS